MRCPHPTAAARGNQHRWLGGLCLALLAGCGPAAQQAAEPVVTPEHCPEPPPVMSVAESLELLARVARETRADLMARVEGLPQGAAFATLHPPGLALIEATLAAPGPAQRLESGWLQRHLLRATLVLQSRTALPVLERGELSQLRLQDGNGRRAELLYLERWVQAGRHHYRIHLDPLFFVQTPDERMRVTFSLPAPGPGGAARRRGQASWQLTRSVLEVDAGLPLLYLMRRARSVRLGRWAALLGQTRRARRLLRAALECAPDLGGARTTLSQLTELGPSAGPATQPTQPAAPPTSQPAVPPAPRWQLELGHDPAADLALRTALLRRLLPLARSGLCPTAPLQQARQALSRAREALAKKDVGWGLPAALTDVDRDLARALGGALDGAAGKQARLPGPRLTTGESAPSAEQVQRELRRRVLLAQSQLVPRWVKGPPPATIHGQPPGRTYLGELQPTLRSEATAHAAAAAGGGTTPRHVVATTRRRLGWGWQHPGLPPGRYAVRFRDVSARFWQRQLPAATAHGRAVQRALIDLARRLLERELHSPRADVALLAARATAEQGPAGLQRVLDLLPAAKPGLRGALLRGVALLRDPRIASALVRAASAAEASLRADVMLALGQRGLATELPLLRRGLDDHAPAVRRAALSSLLRAGDPAGVAAARTLLLKQPPELRRALLVHLAQPGLKLARLAPNLLQLSRREASPALPAALLQALGPRRAAAHLQRLYGAGGPPLRRAVLKVASLEHNRTLLLKAARDSDPACRRQAVLTLARGPGAPRPPLQAATEDEDPLVQLAAHAGLAQLGQAASLLALGAGSRGSCAARALVLPTLCRALDGESRRKLLRDSLLSDCSGLWRSAWQLAQQYHPGDVMLLRAALGHPDRLVRLRAALELLTATSRSQPGEQARRRTEDGGLAR